MVKKIVFDMDNTLVDEFGSTLRPGIIDFLNSLKKLDCQLFLWTNSQKDRAKNILSNHKLNHFFDRCIFREDYDNDNIGKHKDIRTISGELLIDDDPKEIEFTIKKGLKGFLIKSYRKNANMDMKEYSEILKIIKGNNIITKLFK